MCSAQVRPLGDVVRLRTDKVVSKKNDQMPYLGLEHMASGSPHPTRVGRAADSVSTNSVFSEGDILFGKLRPYLRKSATAPFDGYCSTDILVLAPKADIVPSFAAHLLRSELVFREATATAIGTRMPRTSWSGLKDLHVFVPHRREQRRIADILDTLDDAIRKTEEIIAKLQQVKQGLLYDLLTWGIDENGELRDPERDPEQFKETVLGRVPKEWRVVPLDELLTRIEAGKSFSAPDYPAGQGEWGILKVSAVRPEGLQAAENKTVTDSSLINPAYEVRPGDLLITRANTYELVGMTCLAADPPPRLLLSDKTLRLQLREGMAKDFVFHASRMGFVRRQIETHATGSSGSMKNISQGAIRRLRFPLPSLVEQRKITSVLAAQDRLANRERQNRAELSMLKQGLMDDLLTGRVRVPEAEEAFA